MNKHIVLANNKHIVRAVYDEYAALLLGYIYEVVKDKKIAEEYLIAVFNELPQHLQHFTQPANNTYNTLQLIARKMLTGFFETLPAYKDPNDHKARLPAKPNKFLARMSEEQQFVFCSIYYNGKTICGLAAEMNKPIDEIKAILQQAFLAIRRAA